MNRNGISAESASARTSKNVPVLAQVPLDKTRCRTLGFGATSPANMSTVPSPFRALPGTAHKRVIETPPIAEKPSCRRRRTFRLSAVALFELLARAAPARVVPADLVALSDRPGRRRRRDRAAAGEEAARGHRGTVAAPVGNRRRADRLRACDLVVLVREPRGLGRLGLLQALQLVGVLRLELRVEEMADDLLADRHVQLLEHQVALGGVLDERVLLGHRPQVHALAQVVHALQVLAPAR